jgi:hypothetical protein
LLKIVFVSVLCVFNEFVNHGGCWGNTAQTLARWRHPVASSEAWDVLHWAICPALYCLICMATKIASNLRVFFEIVHSVVADNLR